MKTTERDNQEGTMSKTAARAVMSVGLRRAMGMPVGGDPVYVVGAIVMRTGENRWLNVDRVQEYGCAADLVADAYADNI